MVYSLTEREKKILIILNNYVGSYIQGERIAHLLSKSVKTVSNDIHSINQFFHNTAVKIDSKRNNGYQLNILNESQFKGLMENIWSEVDTIFTSQTNKSYDLLCYLLDQNKPIRIQKLIEISYLSESSIRSEIKKMAPLLRECDLSITTKNNIQLQGKEQKIRFLIIRILRNKGRKSETEVKFVDKFTGDHDMIGELSTRIEYLLIKYNDFSISGKSIKMIARFLAVSMNRNRTNHYLRFNDSQLQSDYPYEFCVAKEIVSFAQQAYLCTLTDSDIQFIALLFAISSNPKKILEKNLDNDTIHIANYIINYICEITRNDSFKDDHILCEQIYTYLYAKRLRDKYKIYNESLPFKQIKRKRAAAAELSIMLMKMMEKEFLLSYTEKETLTLLTCLGNIISKTGIYNQKRRIAIASKYGMVESRRILEMLEINFYQYVDEMVAFEVYELNDINLMNFDLVVTDDRRLSLPIPVFLLNKFSLSNEIAPELRNLIQNRINNATRLAELIGDDIWTNLSMENKKEVFYYVNSLYQKNYSSKKSIVEDLIKRDCRVSYEYGNKSAIIYYPDDHIRQLKFHVLLLKKPMLWNEELVGIIFVVFAENTDIINTRFIGGHLPILIENIEFLNEFMSNPTSEIIRKHLGLPKKESYAL